MNLHPWTRKDGITAKTPMESLPLVNIKEIKQEFGDCDWMRAFLNGYAVDAILWLTSRVEELELGQKRLNRLLTPSLPLIIAKDIQIAKDGKIEGGSGRGSGK